MTLLPRTSLGTTPPPPEHQTNLNYVIRSRSSCLPARPSYITMSDSVSKPSITSLIHDYYAQKPNFTQHIGKPSTDADAPSEDLEALHLRSNPKDFPSPEEIRRAFLRKGGYLRKKPANMPVHPAEEHASGSRCPPRRDFSAALLGQ